jgi:hypothetical protein
VGTDSGKEKIAEKVLTKKEKPKLVLVEYYVFDGQFACYRNSREKGQKKRKKTLVSLQQKHPIFRETKPIIKNKIKIKNKNRKAKDPCHVTPNMSRKEYSKNYSRTHSIFLSNF